MKTTIIIIASMLLFGSCNRVEQQCDPSYVCNEFKPDTASIYLDVTINSQNPWVAVAIYQGNVEDGIIMVLDTLYESRSPAYRLPTRENYSAKAIYIEGSGNIIAYDGGRLSFDRIENCDITCYEERSLTLDLLLLE